MGVRRKYLLFRLLPVLCLFAAAIFQGCGDGKTGSNGEKPDTSEVTEPEAPAESESKTTEEIPPGAAALLQSYPQSIKGYEAGYLILHDGSKLLYDDGKDKGFEEMLDHSDPEDQFFATYRTGGGTPEYLSDAGRSRSEQLFKAMYGSSESQVRANLTSVDWFGQKVPFTRINGASEALERVATDIRACDEAFTGGLLKSAGSFYWRKVRGANRLSAHSYGIAIDVGVPTSNYWLWDNPGASETARISYKNRMPLKLVRIFEKHGFIWGGGWYHYDTMHFEYRPEILTYSQMVSRKE